MYIFTHANGTHWDIYERTGYYIGACRPIERTGNIVTTYARDNIADGMNNREMKHKYDTAQEMDRGYRLPLFFFHIPLNFNYTISSCTKV